MQFSNSQSVVSMTRVTEAVMQQMRKAPAEDLQAAFQVRVAPLGRWSYRRGWTQVVLLHSGVC